MTKSDPALHSVQPEDWFATYFIGVAALSLLISLLLMLMMLTSTGTLVWALVPQALFVGLLSLIIGGFVIGVVTALPCALFFWLAQRFVWRNVLIYLLCGAFAALPTIPVVASLAPSSFYSEPPEDSDEPAPEGLARYLPAAPLFAGSGAFLGLVFWWRSGRHLR